MRFAGTIVVLLVVASAPAGAQAVLLGHVRDTSGRALADAQVLLDTSTIGARSDSSGSVLLVVPPRRQVVLVRRLGYAALRRTVRLIAGDTMRAVFTLTPESSQLDTVTARADPDDVSGRGGFAYRRRVGIGSYLDSTQLRRNDGRELSTVLRGMRGLRIVRGPPRTPGGVNQEWAARRGGDCYVSVMIDNVFIYRGLVGQEPPDLRTEIQVTDLDAVEYYRANGPVPPEFSAVQMDCGVLVLWTRRGEPDEDPTPGLR